MMEEDEMMGENDPCEFLYSMCNVVKMKAESYVMLLLRHAAGFIFLLMMHFVYGESERREWSWERCPSCGSIHLLSSLCCCLSSITGDGEAAGG